MGGFGHNISSSKTCRACPRVTTSSKFTPVPFSAERRACSRLLWSVNLPGWRWATIKQVALDRLSRSLHSDVCDSDGCCDAVLHSTISGRGSRRERAAPNISFQRNNFPPAQSVGSQVSSWFCPSVWGRRVCLAFSRLPGVDRLSHTFSAFWL